MVVAVFRDRYPTHKLHYQVRTAVDRRSTIEHLGDVRMVHQSQGLPLRFEPSLRMFSADPSLDELDRDDTVDRLCLLGGPDSAHAAFANKFEQPVSTCNDDAGG